MLNEAPEEPSAKLVRFLGFTYVTGIKVRRRQLFALALIDWTMLALFGREEEAPAPPLEGKTVAVAKIDLLGDVLMITPFLKELRRQSPTTRLLLIVATWSAGAGQLLQEDGLCDEVILYDPPTMSPFRHSWWRKFRDWHRSLQTARARLLELKPDVYIDLRANSPNSILLARLTEVPHKIGFGLRGFSYWLQQTLSFSGSAPMGQQYLDALTALGLKGGRYVRPMLSKRVAQESGAAGVTGSRPFLVLHPFSRNARKMISVEWWGGLLPRLTARWRVIVLGAKGDLENRPLVAALEQTGCDLSAVGQTSFREAVSLVYRAEGFVGVDSVFSHVALAYEKPTLVAAISGASFRPAFPERNRDLSYLEVGPGSTEPALNADELARFGERVGVRFEPISALG